MDEKRYGQYPIHFGPRIVYKMHLVVGKRSRKSVHDKFEIQHATIQFETENDWSIGAGRKSLIKASDA